MMSELCFIGTGGSVATENRDNTSFVLQTRESMLLIDCPGSVVQKLKKLDFDPKRIDALLVTHIHPDHIYGLPSLVHSLMLDECLLRIYGSAETVRFCADLLDLFNLRTEKIKCRVDFISVEDRGVYQLSPSLRCIFFKVPHSPASMAFHFYLENEGIHVIHSGDTPLHTALFQEAKNTDYLIHDCSAPSRVFQKYPSLQSMHTDAYSLGKYAQESGVKSLLPCHFLGEIDFSLKEIEEEIRKSFEGKLIIPQDFSRIPLISVRNRVMS
jgi:ribonuclease Z